MGLGVPVWLKYKECAIRILHSVGFWRIQDSRVQSPFLYMGLDVPVWFKYKECAIRILHRVGFWRIQEGSWSK